MKIIHIVWGLQNGGIETMLVNTANEQNKRGDKVFILIVNDLVDEDLVKGLNKKIKVFKIGRKIGSRNPFPIVWANILILFIYPKIMHFHFLNIAKLFIKFRKIKFISTVHSTKNLKTYFKKYDRFLAISHSVKKVLLKIKPEIETEVCYNGIDFNRVVKKEKYRPIKKVICTGRLIDSVKGQSIIIKALKILKNENKLNIIVTFVGDGKDKMKLQKLTKKLNLQNNINFLGNKSNEWILNNLCEYGLFIQASRFEGFGLTALEAIGAKLPTLLSNVEGHLEISDNGKYTVLFNSEDPKDLANKIIKLSNESEKLENRTEIAYNFVVERFSSETQVDKLEAIYKSL